jgi:hypothetical protein
MRLEGGAALARTTKPHGVRLGALNDCKPSQQAAPLSKRVVCTLGMREMA